MTETGKQFIWKRFTRSDAFRRAKLGAKRLTGKEPRLKPDISLKMQRFHDWTLYPGLLGSGHVVYSLGVGEDIGFDLELIAEKKVEVFAFDPTPNSVRWLKTLELPERFHFHPWAIADKDGSLYLYPRIRRDGSRSKTMYTIMMDKEASGSGTEVPAKTLTTIMKELGHEQIDVLKMDIEGAEYGVLAGLLESAVRPVQILVEFHHRFSGLDNSQTLKAIRELREAGYALAHISSTGREFSFVLASRL
jgi:FkbM family methyltransferase